MKRLALFILVAVALGCHSMSAWRPADGRQITRDEHRRQIHRCRLEARKTTVAIARRTDYASCMVVDGWAKGTPEFKP